MDYTNEFHTADAGLLPFDPIVLIRDVARRWLLVLLAALMVGVGSYIVTDRSYEPVYRTRATFVVTSRSSVSTVYSNLSSTTNLASVFTELLNSSVLRKAILEEMGTQSFDGTIAATAVPETNLLTLEVTASDPRTAFLVARAIIEHHETVTYQVVDGIVLEVLQNPTVPTAPVNYANAMAQMQRMMTLTAFAVCVLLAWMSYAKDVVRSGKEARKKLDCAYLGEIAHENKYKTLLSWLHRRKTSILITNPITSFHFVETIRKLRRRVEHRMRGGKVLMVTSVLENEGKSTVAANLALAMAQKHSRVLLIECDLRKPACHVLLEQEFEGPGVRDVLLGKSNAAEALIQYKNSNLYLMLEKHGDNKSGDLVASPEMGKLLELARQEFDYVLLDLPPMSVASDSESMTQFADASLLVVCQNVAAAPAINKAIDTLEGGRAKLLGCVLNNVHSTALSSGGGYGRKYGGYGKYGHYGHYGADASGDSRK